VCNNYVIVGDWIRKKLCQCSSLEATKGSRACRIRLRKRSFGGKCLDESSGVDGVGFPPRVQIDGCAVGRINPAAIDEHRGVLTVAQQRREDVYAGRSVAPAQSENDLVGVVVAAGDVNSAEM